MEFTTVPVVHTSHGNGHAERAVKTVKNLLSNTEDPWLALLNYRAAPFPESCSAPF